MWVCLVIIGYLGYTITRRDIKIDLPQDLSLNMEAILKCPLPNNVSKVRDFVGET